MHDLQLGGLGRGLFQMAKNVLADHDTHVHDGADGYGDARKGHDIGVHSESLHSNETQQHSQGKHTSDQQAAAQVHHHHDNHDQGDQDFLTEGIIKCAQGFVDQSRTVVEWYDRNLTCIDPAWPVGPRRGPEIFYPAVLVDFVTGFKIGLKTVFLSETADLLDGYLGIIENGFGPQTG